MDANDVGYWAVNYTGSLGGGEEMLMAPPLMLMYGAENLLDKPCYGLSLELPWNTHPDALAILADQGIDVRLRTGLAAPAQSVPEPGALAFLAGATLLLTRRRR